MSNVMKYRGYVAVIELDPDLGRFFGEVVNARDVITFYGSSVEELKREMARSIDAHLAFCRRKGVKPTRPHSGRFNVRVRPETHARVSAASMVAGTSMNAWISEVLDREAKKVLG